MKNKYYELNINDLIEQIKTIYMNLNSKMLIDYNINISNVNISDDFNFEAYQNIGKAFNFVIDQLNQLIKLTWKLQLVDFQTGSNISELRPINSFNISIKTIDLTFDIKLNEMNRKFNQIENIFVGFGFIDEGLFPKEDGYPEITVKKDLYDAPSKSYYTMIYIPYRDRYGEYIELKNGLPQDHLKFTKAYEKPSDFYKRHSTATVISSGPPDHHGVSISNGVVVEDVPTKNARPLAYMNDGTLKVFSDTTTANEFLDAGAKHVWGSFWPFIIDGKKISPSDDQDYVDRLNQKHDPRAIVVQLNNKDKLIISVYGRFENSPGMTLSQLQDFVLRIPDVELAYNMDGGGSEHAIVRGEYITPMYDNNRTTERAVWGFVYIERSKASSVADNTEVLDSLKETTKEAIKRYGKVKLFED